MKHFFSIFLLFFCFNACHCEAKLNGNGDLQLWNYNRFYNSFNDKLGIMIEEEFRVGNNISTFYYQHTFVGLYYKICDWLQIMPTYEQIFRKTSVDGNWFPVYVPFFEVLFTLRRETWALSNRTRFEYEMPDTKKENNFFTFRNQTTYTLPIQWTRLKIQPYLSDEFFITSQNGFNQNRVSAGFLIPFVRQFSTDLYYRFRSIKPNKKWLHQNILGVNLIFNF